MKKVFLPLAALLILVNNAFCDLVRDGNDAMDQGKWDAAIADFTKAIELNPDDAGIYNNRGFAKQSKNDLAGALADYNQAIELKPDSAVAYANRGRIEQIGFDFKDAIADYKRAIKLDPGNVDLKNNLGFAKEESKELKPVVYYLRGQLKQKTDGDFKGAIADYTKAIELKPDYAEAYFSRGYARKSQGDLGGAMGDYTKAIELKPDFAWAYNNRGWCKFLKNDFAGAISDADKAIQIDSKKHSFYDTRSWARYEQGDVAGALEDCEQAISLSSLGAWDVLEMQGLANFINGDYPTAYEQWNGAFQQDPSKQYLRPFIEKAKAKGK
jgi:tetratricopeptide (TPR) repeat protein